MSVTWYKEFVQIVRDFRRHCADAIRTAHERGNDSVNMQPISRAIDAIERHWKKQFPGHLLPHRQDIDRHLRVGEVIDVIDLMTRDINDSEEKALSALVGLKKQSAAAPYVALERLDELRALKETCEFDLSKLIRICEELVTVSEAECHMSTAVLVRALLDHVPALFSKSTFAEVANNYPGTKSFKEVAQNLEQSSRKIADGILHSVIRRSESLPTGTQTDFRQALDVLLGEVVRLARDKN